jgi:hypothetical protein
MKWGFIYTLDEPSPNHELGRVPVGAVFYGVEASAGLRRLFG